MWTAAVALLDIPDYLLPSPTDVVAVLVDDAGLLAGHAAVTVATAVVGLLLGAVAGVALAVAMAATPLVRSAVAPVLVVSQSIPMVVLAPLLVVWFGFGPLPRILVVALVSFFPVALAMLAGLLAADRDHLDLVRAMGGGRADVARHVTIPASLPSLFGGLRVAASYAMFGAVVSEWVGASAGLGVYLERSRASYATDQMFAAVAVIAAVSVALFGLVALLERAVTPWQAADRAARRRALQEDAW